MLRCSIVRFITTRVLTTPASKRLLKVAATSMVKRVRTEQKKSIFPEFVSPLQSESNSDIHMLTSTRWQKLACRKSILKYSDDSVEEDTDDDSLADNLLGDNSPAHIDSNINIDTKAKSNPDENMTDNNLLEKNSGINNEDSFQQVQD